MNFYDKIFFKLHSKRRIVLAIKGAQWGNCIVDIYRNATYTYMIKRYSIDRHYHFHYISEY